MPEETQTLAESLADAQNVSSQGDVTPEPTATSEPEGDTETQVEPKKTHWAQRRIDELTRNWRETQAQNQKLLDLLASKGGEPAKQAVPATGEPKEEDFPSYKEYVKAAARWEIAQARAEEQKNAEVEAEQSEQQEIKTHWQQEYAKGQAAYDDFDEVLANPNVLTTPAMAHVILTSEHGADVAYYLGKHPEEAQRIAALADNDPMGLQMAKEMGKIEARVAQEKSSAGKEPVAQTRAPKPPTPVSRTSATDNSLRDDLSVDEWMKRRNAQLRGR